MDVENVGNNTQEVKEQNSGQVSEEPGQQTGNNTAKAPGTEIGGAQVETPVNGTDTTGGVAPPPLTSTIPPTLPPPPQYTTQMPNTTQSAISNLNVTVKPGQNGENEITSPELPDDEQKIPVLEPGLNVTEANTTDDNGLLGIVEEEKNETITVQGNATGNIGENNTNAADVTKEHEKLPDKNIVANTRPVGEKTPSIAHVDTPNPWLNTAKEVQNQKPMNWQNGQGPYNAIHEMKNGINNIMNGYQNGMAPINYNKGKATGLEEKPVWQYLNGEPEINQLLGQSKFKNVEQSSVGTSPFKFANTKTQKEINSYYTQNKENNAQNNQQKARA